MKKINFLINKNSYLQNNFEKKVLIETLSDKGFVRNKEQINYNLNKNYTKYKWKILKNKNLNFIDNNSRIFPLFVTNKYTKGKSLSIKDKLLVLKKNKTIQIKSSLWDSKCSNEFIKKYASTFKRLSKKKKRTSTIICNLKKNGFTVYSNGIEGFLSKNQYKIAIKNSKKTNLKITNKKKRLLFFHRYIKNIFPYRLPLRLSFGDVKPKNFMKRFSKTKIFKRYKSKWFFVFIYKKLRYINNKKTSQKLDHKSSIKKVPNITGDKSHKRFKFIDKKIDKSYEQIKEHKKTTQKFDNRSSIKKVPNIKNSQPFFSRKKY